MGYHEVDLLMVNECGSYCDVRFKHANDFMETCKIKISVWDMFVYINQKL